MEKILRKVSCKDRLPSLEYHLYDINVILWESKKNMCLQYSSTSKKFYDSEGDSYKIEYWYEEVELSELIKPSNLYKRIKELEKALNDMIVTVNKPKIKSSDLDGLIKDGYTFICPEHGLHPNCDCQDNQIKVFSEEYVDKVAKERYEKAATVIFQDLTIRQHGNIVNNIDKALKIAAGINEEEI